jgi:hypothetical protein
MKQGADPSGTFFRFVMLAVEATEAFDGCERDV